MGRHRRSRVNAGILRTEVRDRVIPGAATAAEALRSKGPRAFARFMRVKGLVDHRMRAWIRWFHQSRWRTEDVRT